MEGKEKGRGMGKQGRREKLYYYHEGEQVKKRKEEVNRGGEGKEI